MATMNEDQRREHAQSHTKENSWWLNDARGIPCCRVCDTCEAAARARYKPEIFDDARYSDVVEEQIDDD